MVTCESVLTRAATRACRWTCPVSLAWRPACSSFVAYWKPESSIHPYLALNWLPLPLLLHYSWVQFQPNPNRHITAYTAVKLILIQFGNRKARTVPDSRSIMPSPGLPARHRWRA